MKKTLLALLLTAAASGHAAPITVTFTYEGAHYESYYMPEGEWMPSARLEASFTGEDLNGDHVIAANELTSLNAQGINYLTPDDETTYYQIRFSYRDQNDYSISVGFSRYYPPGAGDQGWAYGRYETWTPGKQEWGWSNDGARYEYWTSTSQTVATVVSSVPEPTTIVMLGLGLSIIGLSRRRSEAVAG